MMMIIIMIIIINERIKLTRKEYKIIITGEKDDPLITMQKSKVW